MIADIGVKEIHNVLCRIWGGGQLFQQSNPFLSMELLMLHYTVYQYSVGNWPISGVCVESIIVTFNKQYLAMVLNTPKVKDNLNFCTKIKLVSL